MQKIYKLTEKSKQLHDMYLFRNKLIDNAVNNGIVMSTEQHKSNQIQIIKMSEPFMYKKEIYNLAVRVIRENTNFDQYATNDKTAESVKNFIIKYHI